MACGVKWVCQHQEERATADAAIRHSSPTIQKNFFLLLPVRCIKIWWEFDINLKQKQPFSHSKGKGTKVLEMLVKRLSISRSKVRILSSWNTNTSIFFFWSRVLDWKKCVQFDWVIFLTGVWCLKIVKAFYGPEISLSGNVPCCELGKISTNRMAAFCFRWGQHVELRTLPELVTSHWRTHTGDRPWEWQRRMLVNISL